MMKRRKLCIGNSLDQQGEDIVWYVVGGPLNSWNGYHFKDEPDSFCQAPFEEFTGIKLQLGEAVQIKDLEINKRKEKYIENLPKYEEGT